MTLLREGLVRILQDGSFDVIGRAGTLGEFLLKVRSYPPDIVITDLRMPPAHSDGGMRAPRRVRARFPQVTMMVLPQCTELRYALDHARRQHRAGRLPAQRPRLRRQRIPGAGARSHN